MLDAGEVPGWVQKMMGHETIQMIHERYYSHIRNYQRQDGTAFMEKVYKPVLEAIKVGEHGVPDQKCDPNVTQEEKGELACDANSLEELRKSKG
jgi:hypothetical protein